MIFEVRKTRVIYVQCLWLKFKSQDGIRRSLLVRDQATHVFNLIHHLYRVLYKGWAGYKFLDCMDSLKYENV